MLNQECIRDILIFIDKNQKHDSSGRPIPFKFSSFCSDETMKEKYDLAEMNAAIRYLVGKQMLESEDIDSRTPRIHISQITAKGYDYLQVVCDDTLWKKLKSRFGAVFNMAAPVAVEHCITFLLQAVR